ncbi:helix-turn-helix domain-containing protein [Escherichia coli]|nr:helix-turn-helix domain-containing protein [Escherichia coli]EGA8973804.1 helix-turn-helix domain-containing protein [Escherichia coli]EJR8278458.1 helix-turn-helix domain-containing protein [Escherichia coli]HCP5918619.1 helix-turn-helix domain-containing protein [Escherichia coli]
MQKQTFIAIVDWIELNLSRRIFLDDIVGFSGYSRRYIHALFKHFLGMPPGRYILYRRLSRGAVRLRLSVQSVTEIAHQLCFDSLQSFSREFKKLFGISPCNYRCKSEWILSNIQPRIRFEEVNIPPLRMVELPVMNFLGYEFLYNETLGVKSDRCSQLRLNHVIKNTSNYEGEDFFIISKVIPEMSHDNKLEIKVFAGYERNNYRKDSMSKKHSLIPGLYAYFNFTESWDAYSMVFEKLYLEVLPSYGLRRAKGEDIECFKSNNGLIGNDRRIFNVDYYIPVCY